MERRHFLRQCALTLGASCVLPRARGGSPTPPRRPNILMVVVDDVTPAYLGCYGGPTPTPHLDALAAGGVRCGWAHAVSPLCNPSRYTLLTGQLPGRNPVLRAAFPAGEPYAVDQNTRLTEETPTVFRRLRNAGYFTGFVGKWHSNFEFRDLPPIPQDLDLDTPEADDRLRRHQAAVARAVAEWSGSDRASRILPGNLDAGPRPPRLAQHQTEWLTDGALEFLEEAAGRDQPFFLHLANTLPHGPDLLPGLQGDLRYTYGGRLPAPPTSHPARATVTERLRAAGLPLTGPLGSINAGMIQIDDQWRALREKLRQLGLEQNTLVIFTADHGIYGKGSCYAGGTHVPLLAAWPGEIPGGRLLDTPVSLIDLVPTALEAAGALPPDGGGLDGLSLLPLWRGRGGLARSAVYAEMGYTRSLIGPTWQYLELRHPESLLAPRHDPAVTRLPDHAGRDPGTFGPLNLPFKPAYFDPDQFYDLGADPHARRNLVSDPAWASAVAEARQELARRLASLEAPFPRTASPFCDTPRYAELAAGSRAYAASREHYPEGFDGEVIFNLNRRDPLARYE